MEVEVHSLEETKKIAEHLAKTLKPGDVIAFSGGMGAGKTTFTGYLMEALGYHGEVHSPSYTLVNTYPTDDFVVAHYDMYRIDSLDDVYSTGFYDEIGTEKVLIVEWSEKIEEDLPDIAIRIKLTPLGESVRKIEIQGRDLLEYSGD